MRDSQVAERVLEVTLFETLKRQFLSLILGRRS